jgi:DNA-directed RNA polymerase subunit L
MSKISNFKEEDGILTFTVSGLDVSYINALRRTILSDIPIVVFKTIPYEQNKCSISINTSRLNNEIIKQRLSCIPICMDPDTPLKNYILEIDVENKTDTIMYVTTKDFKIKDLTTNTYLGDGALRKIFPPFISPTGKGEYFIDFVRLRPKISDELFGERIKLTCEFSIGTAREDSMFNITGTCSYGFTVDEEKMLEQLEIRRQKWKDEGKSDKEIDFESANWKLLEGQRYVKTRTFDFILQSVGIYENTEIIGKACDILENKFNKLNESLNNDQINIFASDNTMEACYDIILENEDYTLGNILNYECYSVFYSDLNLLDYVGFKKMHPHDDDSVLRLAFTDKTKGISDVKSVIQAVVKYGLEKIVKLKQHFVNN